MRIKRLLEWKFSGGIRLLSILVTSYLSLGFPSLLVCWFGICCWFIVMILQLKARKALSLQAKTEKFKQHTPTVLLRLSCSSRCSSSLALRSQSCLCSVANFSLWILQLSAVASFNHKLLYGFLWACLCSCFFSSDSPFSQRGMNLYYPLMQWSFLVDNGFPDSFPISISVHFLSWLL